MLLFSAMRSMPPLPYRLFITSLPRRLPTSPPHSPPTFSGIYKTMSTSHTERTATVPRLPSIHSVHLSRVEEVNSTVRLFHLRPTNSETIKANPPSFPLRHPLN